MKKLIQTLGSIIPAFLFIFLSISPSYAFFVQTGENLIIPKEKRVDEAAFISGSFLTINADINGDLYCAGRDIVINGNIKGDIACLSQSLTINGSVDGDVRVAGQTVIINGQVTRNLTAISQTLNLGSNSQIKGDIFFGVQTVELNGIMGRDLAGAGETITITGSLLRNATVTSNNLSIVESGKVGGNLDYYMETTGNANLDKKNIKGNLVRHDIQTQDKDEMKKDMARVSREGMVYKTIYGIISFALLGLVLVYFDRKNTERRIASIVNKPFITGLIGFAVLITAPAAFIIVMITLIGVPLAMVALFVYIIAMIIASLYPSAIYGKLVLEKIFQKKNSNLYGQILLGVILLGLVSCIPIIGWMIAFASLCLGLGAFLVSLAPEKN